MDKFLLRQCKVDSARNVITLSDRDVQIEPKVMAVLCELARRPGEVFQRCALLDMVWGDGTASDESLTRAISILRKTFRKVDDFAYIETIPRRGYRLAVDVEFEPGNTLDHGQPTDQSDAADALKLVAEHDAEPAPPSIAVLPFIDLSAEQDQEFLADGIAEEILNALTKAQSLKVSGRTSSFAFKHKVQDIREIASALGVDYVLEGSLRVQGDSARVTAQLIKADGFHLWSETYDRDRNDIFKLQEEIAQSIVEKLTGLLAPCRKSLAVKMTNSNKAYDLFLQGRELTHQLNGQNTIPSGINFLKQAVAIDPRFTEAWAWLGLAHFILPEFSRTPHWGEHFKHSEEAIAQALDIDPACSMALLVKAMQTAYCLKLDQAVGIYEHALALDPNNIETMAGYGLGMATIGQHDIARKHFERVIDLDPLCGIWHTTYGGILLMAGQFSEAEDCFRRSFELGFGAAAFGLAHRMAARGEAKEAVGFLHENFDGLAPAEQAELRSPVARHLMFTAYLRRNPFARVLVGSAMKRRLGRQSMQPTAASIISFLFLEQPGRFLEHILKKPNPYIGYTIARIWEPTIQSRRVREHADFPEFVEAVGLNRAWAKHGSPSGVSLPS